MDTMNPLPIARRALCDLVTDNRRATAVLERYGLDYCCHGSETLEDATTTRGIPLDEVVDALTALGDATSDDRVPEAWATDLDLLTRHIVEAHHTYIREIVPIIEGWLEKLIARHGVSHPELEAVRHTFGRLTADLRVHMAKEENILFPFIEELARARRSGGRLPGSPFGTIVHPVRVMENDHALAGELLDELHRLTGGYAVPPDGCATYRLCYQELERFARDLHEHVHLENNLLFPRAMDVEAGLS